MGGEEKRVVELWVHRKGPPSNRTKNIGLGVGITPTTYYVENTERKKNRPKRRKNGTGMQIAACAGANRPKRASGGHGKISWKGSIGVGGSSLVRGRKAKPHRTGIVTPVSCRTG